MKEYDSIVKCYKRGNSKRYLVALKQDNPFDENAEVVLLLKSDLNKYKHDKLENENELNRLRLEVNELEEFRPFKEKCDVLLNDMDRLRNKHDFVQERLNKSQEEIIKLERELTNYRLIVSKIRNLSFMDRVLNKLPDEVKQLEPKEIKKK